MQGPVFTWEQAYAAGASIVGGKGWNLSRLHRYGFDVPAGGALDARVYQSLIETPQLAGDLEAIREVGGEDVASARVGELLAGVRARLVAVGLPDAVRDAVARFLQDAGLQDDGVAVRSSAVGEDGEGLAFAGIHESILNVRGSVAVSEAILQCYASLWTPQAVAYRRRFSVDDRATPCAVVICRMVGDETAGPVAAGVAFSCEPVTGQREVVTINLARGLGDAVVRGTVQPQQYQVRTRPVFVVQRQDTTDAAAILPDEQVSRLARLVMRVHWALGGGQDPQDVEWAFDGTAFWLLQARPVTRLPRWTFPGVPAGPTVWSNANVGDSLPHPLTTLTWSVVTSGVQSVVYASLEAVDYPIPDGMEVMRCFGGRPYFDLGSLQWGHYDAFGVSTAESNRLMGGFQAAITVPSGNPIRGRAGLARTRRRMRLLRRFRRLAKEAPGDIEKMIDRARALRRRDLSPLSDAALREELRQIQEAVVRFQPTLQLAAAYYGGWMTTASDVLEWATGDRAESLVTQMLAASGDVASAEQGYGLYDLARLAEREPDAVRALAAADPFTWRALDAASPFRSAMEQYLYRYGHRAVFEMEFASIRWHQDPTYLIRQIQFHMGHPDSPDPRARAEAVHARAQADLQHLPWYVRPLVRRLLNRSRSGAGLRENAKSAMAAGVAMVHQVARELGRRFVERGTLAASDDIFHLSLPEIEACFDGVWDGGGAARLVADRRARRLQQVAQKLPGVIEGAAAPVAAAGRDVAPGASADGRVRTGLAAAPGAAVGAACVVSSPHEADRMQRGDVLVAPSTDPGWTPLFLRASAIVMETGGYLSHGAVVAREFGIPAVVNVRDVMAEIRDGDQLRVDGDRGVVTHLPPS
ncbi:MAG: PEP-utilizing enzyme [Acidobacteria bacterium]|nr:PEP-utilizing enzyme [Acidobacteriota bacterium]